MKRLSVWLGLLVVAAGCGSDGGSSAPAVEAGPLALRRLTVEQYRRSIHDIFGDDITVPSRLDPDDRTPGLFNVGASLVSITPSALEKYDAAAVAISTQVLAQSRRATSVGCTPSSPTTADPTCARTFIERVGAQLFRRPLSRDEIDARLTIANDAADELDDFYEGLGFALNSLLVSPDFLFRVETATPDSEGVERLTEHSVASRLSYFLWNSTPDQQLLAAADNGALASEAELEQEVDRLLSSPRVEAGLRAFFSDWFDFRRFDDGLVRKDQALFPTYSQTLIEDAKEQTLRTIVTHLMAGNDYRALFTTRETFVTRALGLVYTVPVNATEGFEPLTFDENGPRAGILSHASIMALYSHPGRSSATLRGKFVRAVLLCQPIPDPPANIDFSILEDTMGPLATARDRLEKHVSEETCATCHRAMDPIGLAFENFDAIGVFRERENNVVIDASGQLDGAQYTDAKGMGQALSEHPELASCFVNNLYRYAVGRDTVSGENELLGYLTDRFSRSGHDVTALLRDVALSEGFATTNGVREATGAQP